MAKYGKGSWRGGHRANYVPGIGGLRNPNSSFSIRTEAMTFNFESNFADWSLYSKHMKDACAKEMRDTLADLALLIGTEAIKRCPHYSGAMAKSIKATIPEVSSLRSKGRTTVFVGLLESWNSPYDKTKAAKNHPKSSPELARYIHEYYDTFIENTEYGRKRRDRKSAVTGARVGSHFLLRAWSESDAAPIIQGFIQRMNLVGRMKATMWSMQTDTAVKDINGMLEQYANSIDIGEDTESEDAYGNLFSAVKSR